MKNYQKSFISTDWHILLKKKKKKWLESLGVSNEPIHDSNPLTKLYLIFLQGIV